MSKRQAAPADSVNDTCIEYEDDKKTSPQRLKQLEINRMAVGRNLLRLRKKQKLKQCELSERSGVSPATIRKLEAMGLSASKAAQPCNLTYATLCHLAAGLGVPVEELCASGGRSNTCILSRILEDSKLILMSNAPCKYCEGGDTTCALIVQAGTS